MNGWVLFEIGINAYQAMLLIYFVRHRFHMIRPQLTYAWIAGALTCGALSLYLFFYIPITDTVIFIIPLTYAWFISDDAWYLKMFWIVALATAVIGITNLMINIFLLLFNATWNQIMSETALRIAFIVCLNISLLAVILVMVRIGKSNLDVLSWITSGIFLLILLVDLAIIELLYATRAYGSDSNASSAFATTSVCVLLSASLVLALYEIMSASATRQKKTAAELQKIQLLQSHYEEMKNIYSYMASYEHDLKHKFNLIQTLLADGQREKGAELYNKISFLQDKHYLFVTGSIAVDALLTVKKLAMEKCNIRFEFQPYPLQELPIDESVFCVILSNILDNAIEGINRLNDSECEHVIQLKLARSWDILFVTCTNDMLPASIHKTGTRFLSSKKEGIGHGFGIENVKKTVNAANGQCKFITNDCVFRVEIILPFEKMPQQQGGIKHDMLSGKQMPSVSDTAD